MNIQTLFRRWPARRAAGVAVAAMMAVPGGASLAPLRPETNAAWDRYVAAVEARRSREWDQRTVGRFFAMDALAGGTEERRRALAGELVVSAMRARDARGTVVETPSALVHHWRGTVFVPGVTLAALLDTLETRVPASQEILDSKVLARGPSSMKVYLRLRRTKVITVVYDTEHDVAFVRDGSQRAASTSIATRIVEIDEPGTPAERERSSDDDHGFLWRLRAYWRYAEVEGGVLAECESISLSRSAPFGLRTALAPVIRSTARESMERTLDALRRVGSEG